MNNTRLQYCSWCVIIGMVCETTMGVLYSDSSPSSILIPYPLPQGQICI